MKKRYLFILLISIIGFTACDNSKKLKTTLESSNEIPFQGTWSRSFELRKDSLQFVYYRVWEDSIHYEMEGPLSLNYTIHKDTFLTKENRWIGNLEGNPYVIFLKNISSDSITLFKENVETKEEALTMPFPSDTAKSRFSTWDVFYLKKL